MKASKVKIENFRNIKSLEFDVSNATVISGENELGKSNALNALVWFFTNTIYTDNSGVGENDINSIIPKNQSYGENTMVTVEFPDGKDRTFTKVYVSEYNRDRSKVTGHHHKYMMNFVDTEKSVWESKLFEKVGFQPCFKSVKELNLFIDPLYALQKLDAKDLRLLLVSFGCTATNEEMYQLGFDDLRQYENKYLGDFVKMRVDLKKQSKMAAESVKKYEILLSQFNGVEEFDNSKMDAINEKLNKLHDEKSKLMTNSNDDAIRNYEFKLKEIKLKLENERDSKISEMRLKIKELQGTKELELEAMKNAKEQETREAKAEISRLEAEIKSAEISLKAYKKSYDSIKNNLANTNAIASSVLKKKTDYQSKLVSETQREFTGYVTCPSCGETFPADDNAYEAFKNEKKSNIEFYTQQINQFNQEIEKYHNECKEMVKNGKQTEAEIEVLEKNIAENNAWLDKNKTIVNDIMNAPVDTSRLDKIDADISKLNNDILTYPTVEGNSQVATVEAKIKAIKEAGTNDNILQVNDINMEIDEAESEREELYIERSNWNQKLEHQENYNNAVTKLNDIESLIQRVNDYIHTMIKVINDKAKAKTGMDFVMLEENLGNDGVKEVCYAVVDGVPFSMINTAKKYECGIHFIEKVKDIAVKDFKLLRNDLPILADKFEGIDHIEKIKSMTNEQLICTRVGLEKEITIL